MIDDDKPRRHQRWLMVLESVKGAEHRNWIIWKAGTQH